MKVAMREMSRVLKPNGYLVLIAANNRISGRVFRTVDYLRNLAEESGLYLIASFVDAIRSRGLMTKRNDTASLITRESVLIFTKGALPEWCQ
jgi:ubiquinone/menaquinone biosynthesis C-methylase UbiE